MRGMQLLLEQGGSLARSRPVIAGQGSLAVSHPRVSRYISTPNKASEMMTQTPVISSALFLKKRIIVVVKVNGSK